MSQARRALKAVERARHELVTAQQLYADAAYKVLMRDDAHAAQLRAQVAQLERLQRGELATLAARAHELANQDTDT